MDHDDDDYLQNISQILADVGNVTMPRFYSTVEFMHRMRTLGVVTGVGAVASEVRLIPRTTEVVKLTRPCGNARKDLRLYCEYMTNENAIRKIPYGDKILIELPNFLSEAIIGGYMGKLSEARYTFHLMPVYGAWLNVNEQTAYTILPQLQTDLRSILKSPADVYLMLFQVSQGLSVAQEISRLSHNDVHSGNILYEKTPRYVNYYRYPIIVDRVIRYLYVQNRGYLTMISDYGLSRMETETYVINGLVDEFPIRNHGIFDQNVDIVSLLSSLFLDDKPDNYFRWIRHLLGNDYEQIRKDIFTIVFGRFDDFDRLVAHYYPNFPRFWRPATKGRKTVYLDINSMHTITRLLGERLVDFRVATPDDRGVENTISLVPLPRYDLISPWHVEGVDLDVPSITQDVNPVAPGIMVESTRITYNSAIDSWEFTPTEREIAECPLKTQYVHILYIDLIRAYHAGYTLKQDCCKLDTMSYISNKFGAAVNGTYFNIKGDFFPIGPFKMEKENFPRGATNSVIWRQDLPVPQEYRDVYGVVLLPSEKQEAMPQVHIRLASEVDLVAEYDAENNVDMFLAGPMLVHDGEIVADDRFINNILHYKNFIEVKRFQCSKGGEQNKSKVLPPGPYTTYKPQMGVGCISQTSISDSTFNCDIVKPGELSHLSNPNPRTMMMTRENRDGKGDLALVYIEGRDSRGMGITAVDMASLAKSIGAINAVNLDGGRSSALSWRTENNPDIVMTANSSQKEFYPVGNIIAITK